MCAVLLVGHGGPDQLVYRRDVPVPLPGPGELLIAVRAAGVNNTDINTRIGWYSTSTENAQPEDGSWTGAGLAFPRIQGADVCGEVVAVGEGVDEGRGGERVIVQSCLRSLERDGREQWLGSELDGGFAQLVRAPAADTYRVECTLTDAQLAAVPCSYATAITSAPRRAASSTAAEPTPPEAPVMRTRSPCDTRARPSRFSAVAYEHGTAASCASVSAHSTL